jgi:hypothetical protein
MPYEEKEPFLNEDDVGRSLRQSAGSAKRNYALNISLAANVLLFAVCLLLSGTVFFLSGKVQGQGPSNGQPELADPYCAETPIASQCPPRFC